MMGFGATEALIVLGIVVLLFGGRKIPELGRAFGKSISNFKKGLNESEKEEVSSSIKDDSKTV